MFCRQQTVMSADEVFLVAATATAVTTATTAAATAATTTTAAVTAATTTAVTAATTVAAAEAAATWSAWLHRTGFVDNEITAAEVGAMHALDGGLGFSIAAHFDKAETL